MFLLEFTKLLIVVSLLLVDSIQVNLTHDFEFDWRTRCSGFTRRAVPIFFVDFPFALAIPVLQIPSDLAPRTFSISITFPTFQYSFSFAFLTFYFTCSFAIATP